MMPQPQAKPPSWQNNNEATDVPGTPVASSLRTHCRFGFDLFEHRFRPAQGFLNVGADVLAPYYLFEFRLVNHLRRLLARAAQDQGPFGGMQLLGDFLQRK